MTEYNKDTAARLVAEAREDDEQMTPGPWSMDPVRYDGHGVQLYFPRLRFFGDPDGEYPWSGSIVVNECNGPMRLHNDTTAGIARTRNNLAALVAQLEAAGAEVERLTKERDEARAVAGIGEWANDVRQRAELAKKLRTAEEDYQDAHADRTAWKEAHENALASWDVDRKNLSARIDSLADHLARLSLAPAEVEALRWIRVMLREDDDVQQRYGWKQDYRVAGEILDRLLAAAEERKP